MCHKVFVVRSFVDTEAAFESRWVNSHELEHKFRPNEIHNFPSTLLQ